MSTAASTVPAKRPAIRAKTTRIPALTDVTPSPRTKHKNKKHKNNADVLVIKHNSNRDYDETYEDVLTDADEDTWIKRTNNMFQRGINVLEKPSKPVLTDRNNVGKGGMTPTSEGNKPTIKILNVEHYEQLMEEKRHLAEMNLKYEERIHELEEETARVMAEFSKLYEDNEKLRRKMDTGKDPLLEPYSRVFEDRRILREAEHGYKKRIERLEEEIKEKQRICEKFMDENKSLREKIKPTSKAEEKANQLKEAKLQVEIRKLKAENQSLLSSIKLLNEDKGGYTDSFRLIQTIPSNMTQEKEKKEQSLSKQDKTKKRNTPKTRHNANAVQFDTMKWNSPKTDKNRTAQKYTSTSTNGQKNSTLEAVHIFDYMYSLPDSLEYE